MKTTKKRIVLLNDGGKDVKTTEEVDLTSTDIQKEIDQLDVEIGNDVPEGNVTVDDVARLVYKMKRLVLKSTQMTVAAQREMKESMAKDLVNAVQKQRMSELPTPGQLYDPKDDAAKVMNLTLYKIYHEKRGIPFDMQSNYWYKKLPESLKNMATKAWTDIDKWRHETWDERVLEDLEKLSTLPNVWTWMPISARKNHLLKFTATTYALKPTGAGALQEGSFTSAQLDQEAVKFGAYINVDYDELEDSAVAIEPFVRSAFIKAFNRSLDTAIINGDTTGVHRDTGGNFADVETYWMGLRYSAIDDGDVVDFGNAYPTYLLLLAMRAKGAAKTADPTQCIWVVGPITYINMFKIDQVATLDKYGPSAVIHKGELGQFAGSSLIMSPHQRDNLNASGVYDGITTDYGAINYFNKNAFAAGLRRDITMDTEKNLIAQYLTIGGIARYAWGKVWANANALGYKVKTT